MKEELSEYEKKRLERIKRNKELLDSLFPDLSPKKQPKIKPTGEKRKERRRRNSAPYEKRPLLIRRNPTRDARTSLSLCPEGAIITDPTEPGMLDDDFFDGVMGTKMKCRFSGKLSKSYEPDSTEIVFDEDEEEDDITSYSEAARRVAFHVSDKVYNKHIGTSCHQCRQKTLDQKTRCRNKNCRGVRGQFCGVCLLNRYGEDAVEAISDKRWVCPPCRGCCNCSFCLPKRGKRPTGVLTPFIKARGFNNVKEYLASFDDSESDKEESDMEFDEDDDKENIDPVTGCKPNGFQAKIRITAPLLPRRMSLEIDLDDLPQSVLPEIRVATSQEVTVAEIRASTERLDISSEDSRVENGCIIEGDIGNDVEGDVEGDVLDGDGDVILPEDGVSSDTVTSGGEGGVESMVYSPAPNKKKIRKSPKQEKVPASLRATVKRCLVVWESGRYTGGYQWLPASKVTDLDYSKPQVGSSVKVKWGKSAKHSPAMLVEVEKAGKRTKSLEKKIGMLSGA